MSKEYDVIIERDSDGFLVATAPALHDGRCTVVPVHAGEDLGPGILSKILRDCELTREDLQGLL